MEIEEEWKRLVRVIQSGEYNDASRDDVLASVGRNTEVLRFKVM